MILNKRDEKTPMFCLFQKWGNKNGCITTEKLLEWCLYIRTQNIPNCRVSLSSPTLKHAIDAMSILDINNDGECEYDELQIALCHMMETNDNILASVTTVEHYNGEILLLELLLYLLRINNVCMNNAFKYIFHLYDKNNDGIFIWMIN